MSKYRIKLSINEEFIQKAKRRDGRRCPIKRAATAAFAPYKKRIKFINVNYINAAQTGNIEMRLHGRAELNFPLPKKARKFIANFDVLGREYVKPFSFIVDLGKAERALLEGKAAA